MSSIGDAAAETPAGAATRMDGGDDISSNFSFVPSELVR